MLSKFFLTLSACLCLTGALFGITQLPNTLIFTFDASEQTVATGTYLAILTLPNDVIYTATGQIGTGSTPTVIELVSPTYEGVYVASMNITLLNNGPLNSAQGPYITAQNITLGDHKKASFAVANVNDQDSVIFVNR